MLYLIVKCFKKSKIFFKKLFTLYRIDAILNLVKRFIKRLLIFHNSLQLRGIK